MCKRQAASEQVREFNTGATRDQDIDKYDYEGFLSPAVIERFGKYMHKHRLQSDGKLRDSDNWQKGIPRSEYVKSLLRHCMDLWMMWRGHVRYDDKTRDALTYEDVCCAIMFNVMGFLHETLKEKARCD